MNNSINDLQKQATNVAPKRGRPPKNIDNVDVETSGIQQSGLNNLSQSPSSDELPTRVTRPSMSDRTPQQAEDSLNTTLKNRVPLHKQSREVLIGLEREGYKRRIFNDENDKIRKAQLAGWNICYKDAAGNILGDRDNKNPSLTGQIITFPVGGGKTGVLMEIPTEIFEADQLEKANLRIKHVNDMMHASKDKGIQYKTFNRTESVSVAEESSDED